MTDETAVEVAPEATEEVAVETTEEVAAVEETTEATAE